MKKIILTGFLLFSTLGFTQNIKGKYLPNEVMPLQRINKGQQFRHPQNFSAEVFIRIPEIGRYRITIDDQSIENSNGMFRFFDLGAGRHILSIYEGEALLYKTSITTRNQHRLVLEFLYNDGLFLLEEINLYQPHISPPKPQYGGVYFGKRVMSPEDFNAFFSHFRKQHFDDDRLKTFKSQNTSVAFTSNQISRMIKTMSFDKNKISLAKTAFETCADPENFYQVIESLDFSSSKNELKDFISKYQR